MRATYERKQDFRALRGIPLTRWGRWKDRAARLVCLILLGMAVPCLLILTYLASIDYANKSDPIIRKEKEPQH